MAQDVFDAIALHDLEMLDQTLKDGADPNEPKQEWLRIRPLHAAIVELEEGGSLDAIKILLRYGADIDATYSDIGGGTPLLTALFNGHVEAARLLIEAGADPSVKGEEGDSPLRWAVTEGDYDFTSYLLDKGAGRTIDSFSGLEGATALGIAVKKLDLDMIRLLIHSGANVEALDMDYNTADSYLPGRDADNAAKWDEASSLLTFGKNNWSNANAANKKFYD